jgi:putative peptide zinc metalloprotease protein
VKPVVRPGLRLLGPAKDTGYEDTPWLVELDGRYLQLSELLYRVAEKCDGAHSLEEIAEEVSEAMPYRLNPEQAAYLLETKLAPLGLLQEEEEEIERGPPAAPSDLFALRFRTQLLSPRLIAPLADTLQLLYRTPVLIPALVLIVALHVWLYLNFNPIGSLAAVLLAPQLLLLVVALSYAGALIHEIGHAAALHHGGGRARGIGIGFYLVFPTFYTDVTDGYRLSRAGRIRTDLGGFFFHLLFSAGVILALLLFVDDPILKHGLIAAALLINLDAARQLLPFVRLDGYWVLVDAAGVHDFMSQAPAFIRGILPWTEYRLRLKRVATVIFAIYLVVFMPLLVGSMGYFLWRLPLVLASLWESLQYQVRAALLLIEFERWLLALSFAVGAALVAIVMVGMAVMAGALLKSVVKLLQAGFARPQTRLATGVLSVAVAVFLSVAWLPRFPEAFAPEARLLPPAAQRYEVNSNEHVLEPVSYPQSPPVGGPHHPEPLACGFYDEPVANERVVHTLEHGAVWIAFRPGVTEAELRALREFAESNPKLVVSPYPGLSSPLVLSAWGVQMPAGTLNSSEVKQFIRVTRDSASAPEAGAPC